MVTEYFFTDRDSLFTALVYDCQKILTAAIAEKQSATFMVSGGSTPQPLYQQLAKQQLDWQKIHIALVDERWVDCHHAGSNEAFIANNLMRDHAAAAQWIAMKTAEQTAALGLANCEQRYQELPRPFDLTVLGMGPDGHTASLFPGAQGLQQALDISHQQLCTAIEAKPSEVTGELTERISLSLFGLLQSKQLHLLITGEEKLAVYRQALANRDIGKTPVSAVLQQQTIPVKVYWAP
ncbi:6-phosphogluconolactonase [Oceanicoccus sagamiensis]|uniref:6-phosphogluconolactonase n=1 Tax=Oceanicoccus sagamiensis TaxID=716816 RepID=A0A1X9NJQ8_9GAMM|nr:6-phosphogluconolactonase [Oceanicoccus sagamiensis]ARN75107.1 6-phosphogluconolactonase [Oceanicoccus sagamiensis]